METPEGCPSFPTGLGSNLIHVTNNRGPLLHSYKEVACSDIVAVLDLDITMVLVYVLIIMLCLPPLW